MKPLLEKVEDSSLEESTQTENNPSNKHIANNFFFMITPHLFYFQAINIA